MYAMCRNHRFQCRGSNNYSCKKTHHQEKDNTQKENRFKKQLKKETSHDVKRKEAATQKEIKETKQKIELNEKEVAAGLSLLGELDISIQKSKSRISDLSAQVSKLNSNIDSYSKKIADDEKNIETLRNRYIQAVKKMRSARKQTSTMGFIFSSDNFYQAYRRIRYLRKFSEWRSRQVSQIKQEIRELEGTKKQLSLTRKSKDRALNEQQSIQLRLSDQQYKQQQTVNKLRANGDALRSHLARKQAEANQLQSRMTQLIAAEQAAAEAEKRRREEQARIAAEQQRKREEAEAAEAERRRIQQEKAEHKAAQEAATAKQHKKEVKKESSKKKETKKNTDTDKNYAQARGRKARSESASSKPSKSSATTSAATNSPTSGFAGMKGSLPRPVSGSFTIINRFGPHPLPDLPDVMFDNPGIDAKVGKGESAKAVYEGTVSGVYMINGFSNVVLVNHGEYFTVYGNIASPAVSKGQNVKQGQSLGKLATDPDDNNRTTIHFEVWKGRTKLNPAEWIR